jgi:hypothetical protein
VSYNAKAIGTVQFVYDGRDFVSPVQPPEMVKRVPTLLERGAELRAYLHPSQSRFREGALRVLASSSFQGPENFTWEFGTPSRQ